MNTNRVRRSGFLLAALAYLGFVSIGLPDGLLGVAWPSIHAFFGIPLDALGTLLVMFTAGYLVSSFSSGWLLARWNVGTLLALSCLATAVSLLGYALASWWGIVLALGVLAGLGAGAIDAGLNTYAATHFSTRSVNWLHAWVSVYWGSLTAGRLLAGLVVGIVPVRLLLRGCVVGIAAGAALVWLNPTPLFGFLGLALMGLSCAPVFPSLIATTPERLGEAHTANGVGFQIAAAVLGQSLLPAFIGMLAGHLGLEIVGPALLTAALLLLVLFESMATPRLRKRPEMAVAAERYA